MPNACYPNEQKYVSVSQALDTLLSSAKRITKIERVDTMDTLGRVLATSQLSTMDNPPTDNSSMDGYAIASRDVSKQGETRLPISQRITAGSICNALIPGTAARIFTGASIPPGADTVVMQEHCKIESNHAIIHEPITKGSYIRRKGEDIAQGDVILKAATLIRPQDMGLAASVGLAELPVLRRLRVAMLTTGNELTLPGTPLTAGKIYNSNHYTLSGLIHNLGCELVHYAIVADDKQSTKNALYHAAQNSDLVISSGGVSVGEEDHIKTALAELGKVTLWRIAVKPGKPLVFGHIADTPFMGLPGNPVSSFVTFCLFATPYIKRCQGISKVKPSSLQATANFTLAQTGPREEYLRGKLESNEKAENIIHIFDNQSSGVLSSLTWANGLVRILPGQTILHGDIVEFIPFSEFDI